MIQSNLTTHLAEAAASEAVSATPSIQSGPSGRSGDPAAVGKQQELAGPPVGERFRGGKIYEPGSGRSKVLYTLRADLQAPTPSRRIFTSSYLDSSGKEVLRESAEFENFQLLNYEIRQFQVGEIYSLKVSGRRMKFTTVTRGDQARTSDEEFPENLVIGPSFVPFIQLHWDELKSGRSVDSRLAVLDRRETFGFSFSYDREKTLEVEAAKGKGYADIRVIRMKPKSPFVSAVVKPVYFVFTADGSRLLELSGRMLPKLKSGSDWRDFDADAVFTY